MGFFGLVFFLKWSWVDYRCKQTEFSVETNPKESTLQMQEELMEKPRNLWSFESLNGRSSLSKLSIGSLIMADWPWSYQAGAICLLSLVWTMGYSGLWRRHMGHILTFVSLVLAYPFVTIKAISPYFKEFVLWLTRTYNK